MEDSRRLSALEDANARLEQSVAAYQEEREQYAADFEKIKRQVASATSDAVRRQ